MTRNRRKPVDEHGGNDPMLFVLARAPLDNEASDDHEEARAAAALATYRRGEAISSAQLRAELGL